MQEQDPTFVQAVDAFFPSVPASVPVTETSAIQSGLQPSVSVPVTEASATQSVPPLPQFPFLPATLRPMPIPRTEDQELVRQVREQAKQHPSMERRQGPSLTTATAQQELLLSKSLRRQFYPMAHAMNPGPGKRWNL